MGYIALSKSAFFNNVDFYSNLLGSKTKVCIALKDNAYGHGLDCIGKLSQEYGIEHCIVRDIDEANRASAYDFRTIIVLYEIPKKSYPENYIFAINSMENLFITPANTKIELKIDTGMSRNGIVISQIEQAIEFILKNNLILNGVFTHFCCADEDNNIINNQEKLFLEVIKQIKIRIKTNFRVHCANTAAINKIEHNLYDIGRIGIGLYGYSKPVQKYLKPVLSLWATKISTRVLNINDSIGYGSHYKILKNNTIVSNYDIGYGDGFFRIDENTTVYIKNKKKILGRISMDSFSIEGDDQEICIFDNATYLSNIHNTIEYEILAHLLPRIKRVIIE